MTDEITVIEDRRAPDDVVVSQVRHERRKNWHEPDSCQKLVDVEKRLDSGDARMARIEVRLDDGDARMSRMETSLNANTVVTNKTSEDVSEVLDILTLGKSFFRLIGIFGSIVKWAALIAAPVLVVWYTWKGGSK